MNGDKQTSKRKTIIRIEILVIIAALILAVIIPKIKIARQQAAKNEIIARNAKYSVDIDGAENGEISLTCKVSEASNQCETMKVSGTYTRGENGFIPTSEATNFIAQDGKITFDINASATKSDADIPDQTIKISFSDNFDYKFYEYTLLVHIKLDDASKQRLKAIEDQKAAEAAEKAAANKAQSEANSRISKLKSCQIATSEWTDDEAVTYHSEYTACANKEYQSSQKSWESTAPSQLGTRQLCRQQLESTYPYGTKIHSIAGVLVDAPDSADTRFYKVEVDVTNAFGATRSTVMECRVRRTSDTTIRIEHFYVY